MWGSLLQIKKKDTIPGMKGQREHWASHFGFIMAAAGSAIGLGSLWRFPYTAGDNGGGAFVLLYIAFTFLLGVPIFIGELMIGRRAQRSPDLCLSISFKPVKQLADDGLPQYAHKLYCPLLLLRCLWLVPELCSHVAKSIYNRENPRRNPLYF